MATSCRRLTGARPLRAVLLRLLAGAAPAAALLLLLAGAAPAGAQVRVRWEADERILIGPFAQVIAVAADGWRLHAATPAGLISYDPLRRRWDPPLTFEDGYPAHEQPTALAAPRGEQRLVLGTRLGTLWEVDALGRRFDRITSLPGAVQRIVSGEFGALHVRTDRGWFRLDAGSAFAQPLAREPAGARETAEPRLEGLRARLGLDARLRRWPITAVVPAGRPDEYFVGTGGAGVLRVDARTLEVEPLPYGLGSGGVGVVAEVGTAVWFGGDGSTRGGVNLAVADSALQQWEWPGTAGEALPQGFTAAIVAHAGGVWAGAADGLFRYDVAGRTWQRFDTRHGLPGTRVSALLVHDSTLWVATHRGACAWSGERCGPPLLPGADVRALSRCHGALWLGTSAGLVRATAAEPPARAAEPALRAAPIQALACMADTLYVATPQDVWVNRAGSWHGPLRLAARGTLRALAVRGQTLWIGGDGGVAKWDAAAAEWTYYIAPGDIPITPVWSLLPTDRYLWLGTPGGAVRLELRHR